MFVLEVKVQYTIIGRKHHSHHSHGTGLLSSSQSQRYSDRGWADIHGNRAILYSGSAWDHHVLENFGGFLTLWW